jgi:hypothetical protein
MIVARLLAFILVVGAVALVPAPLRAQACLRANPSAAGSP